MESRLVIACAIVATLCLYHSSHVRGQTATGDTLRGAGALASGAGWYNLSTAKANAINVEAMRNYNKEARLNYLNRASFWAAKKESRKLSREEAAKRAAARLKQLRDNPTNDDIRSGDALNLLAVLLTDPDISQKDWYLTSYELPSGATVKDVVFQYYPNKMTEKDLKIDVALSRIDDQVDWPLVLTADAFNEERAGYEQAVSKVKQNVIYGKVNLDDVDRLQDSLSQLEREIATTYEGDRRGYLLKAKDFYGKLKSANKLFDGEVVDYAQELLRETEEYDAETVGELLAFMLKYRLLFAEAETPRSIELYTQLYQVMDRQVDELGVKVPELDIAVPDEPVAKDQFPFGTVLKGTADMGVKGKGRVAPLASMVIKTRDGEKFSAFFTIGRVDYHVHGVLPSKEKSVARFATRNGHIQFEGRVVDGGIDVNFSGRGIKGEGIRGTIPLRVE